MTDDRRQQATGSQSGGKPPHSKAFGIPATIQHHYEVRVGYADTDRMGFAHHSRYIVYMESARTELLRRTGDSYAEWEEKGILLPLTEVGVTYFKAALYDDVLRIHTTITELSRLRIRFAYDIHCDARGIRIAHGFSAHVFMNKENRPTRVGPEVLSKLQRSK